MKLYVCLDDLHDELFDMKSIPHIQEAIEKHLSDGGEMVLEYRYVNAPNEVRHSFSTPEEFSNFLSNT